jgi:hypothetical protein
MAVSTKIFILVFALWALYYFAQRLDLGSGTNIRDADHARQIAQDELIGFIGGQVLIDHDGRSALIRCVAGSAAESAVDNAANNYAYIRRHGAHFVAHLISDTSIIYGNDDTIMLRHPGLPEGAAKLQAGHFVEPWTTHFLSVQNAKDLI